MASSSLKKTTKENIKILSNLRLANGAILASTLFLNWLFNGSIFWFIFFNIPNVTCHFLLEKFGSPKFKVDPIDGYKKIVNSGENLNQSGLIEYLFDVIYFNLFLDVLSVVTKRAWYGWIIIPLFVGYKLSGFILPFLPKFSGNKQPKEPVQPPKEQKKKEKRKIIR
ncbi:SRP-independent targeting protein 2 [[Candida] jaroonii]|uniref:SRP-independent targeting protein 2 n=1 Tax=[Candida] jaroonii TaxID=467808 RepID=A0ACA9Y7W3_9ASCO|nr:SRP-independent targeting protein 2 [[Candida] jaroonii]